MEMITLILYVIILLTSIPVGYLLSWLCKEELSPGKKWFKLILYCLIIILIVLLLVYRDIPILLSLIYMIIITLISLNKGRIFKNK